MNPVRKSSRSPQSPSTGGGLSLAGNILKSNPDKQHRDIISNGVKDKEYPIREAPELFIYIDGASRGNPGRAGAGVYITDGEGRRIVEKSRYLGHKTNNEAEYGALLFGLKEAMKLGVRNIHIYTDSELIERQVKGIYRVRELHLRALHKMAMEHLKTFASFEIESIPRKENQEADLLANDAIERMIAKEKEKGGIGGGTDGRSPSPPVRGGDRGEESPSSTGQGGP